MKFKAASGEGTGCWRAALFIPQRDERVVRGDVIQTPEEHKLGYVHFEASVWSCLVLGENVNIINCMSRSSHLCPFLPLHFRHAA